MSCYAAGRALPRLIRNRHEHDHPAPDGNDLCPGCLPCPEHHCRVCLISHVDDNPGACPTCIAAVRDNLAEIARLCASLPDEAELKGVDSEAFNLLGPVADPEARAHAEASYKAGRLPEGWLETGRHGKECPLTVNEACTGCSGHEHHPLTVTWWWNLCYREALDHGDVPTVGTGFGIADLIDYLDRNLSYVASYDDVTFEDMARDLRACVNHLESVLTEGEQIETSEAPCLRCNIPLVREWGKLEAADGWRCPRCREFRDTEAYRLNVAQMHLDKAAWLTDREMEARTGVRAVTVRAWGRAREGEREPLVRKRRHMFRTEYNVEDVERVADEKGLMTA